ncbi:hypothetical protein BC828DRAFT_409088 [Blastocladiella britannica]|nr:hypothetical protein BC828DRAFT_409088 [Blastocladiella britannica]
MTLESRDLGACAFSKDGLNFDLRPLRRINTDYFARTRDDAQFYFNLCGGTVEPKCRNAGACRTLRNNSTAWTEVGATATLQTDLKNTPKDPPVVLYRMRSADPTCSLGGSSTFSLELKCAKYANGTEIPETKPQYVKELEHCEYLFEMTSKFACPVSRGSAPTVDTPGCTLNGNRYSLLPLSLSGSNYKIETPLDTFWLNTCGPVHPNANDGSAGCPADAAICALAKDEAVPKYRNLGRQGQLSVENGLLSLVFHDGETCADGAPRATTVQFPCTSSLQGDRGGPKVLQGHTACGKTVFEFPSRAGCDVTTLGMGAGGIIAWTLFSLLLTYFIGRLAYNMGVKRMSGLEAVPHIDAMIDGIEWVRSKWRGHGRIQI